jgi:hypothetical protein
MQIHEVALRDKIIPMQKLVKRYVMKKCARVDLKIRAILDFCTSWMCVQPHAMAALNPIPLDRRMDEPQNWP